jgi:Cu/Ag efflux pump CusA
MSINLSAIAVRERAVTLFFILLLAAAGVYAFVMLGRAEDPSFTIKTLTVTTVWPGATAREMQDLVAEPLEKRLSGADLVRPRRDDHAARICVYDGYTEGQHAAICRSGGVLPGPQEARR